MRERPAVKFACWPPRQRHARLVADRTHPTQHLLAWPRTADRDQDLLTLMPGGSGVQRSFLVDHWELEVELP
jgi:hypothetical protein